MSLDICFLTLSWLKLHSLFLHLLKNNNLLEMIWGSLNFWGVCLFFLSVGHLEFKWISFHYYSFGLSWIPFGVLTFCSYSLRSGITSVPFFFYYHFFRSSVWDASLYTSNLLLILCCRFFLTLSRCHGCLDPCSPDWYLTRSLDVRTTSTLWFKRLKERPLFPKSTVAHPFTPVWT